MFDTTENGILNLIAAGESEQVEFKRRLPPGDLIARTLTAFANTSGGVLILGVDDSGRVLGLSPDEIEEARARLQETSISLLSHPLQIGTVEISGQSLLFAAVESNANNGPIFTARGELFSRQGASDKLVTADVSSDKARPILFRGAPGSAQVVVFVAMSFREEQEPALVDYLRAMQQAAKHTGLPISLRRIDLQEGDYEISQQIMKEIDKAEIMVADFTLNAANVYFELGYARARHCYVIQTARKGTLLEFDIRNWKTIFYRNATELEERLVGAFRAAYEVVRASHDAGTS